MRLAFAYTQMTVSFEVDEQTEKKIAFITFVRCNNPFLGSGIRTATINVTLTQWNWVQNTHNVFLLRAFRPVSLFVRSDAATVDRQNRR